MNIKRFTYWVANLFLVFSLFLLNTSQPARAESAARQILPVMGTTPRTETLYFNGLQWGSVIGWNPYSSSNNNALAVTQDANAIVTVWETPYIYNMLDGKQYPLLADGPWTWNGSKTELTFKIKAAAHWSDGTPVTAEDVAYTWATHVEYGTFIAYNYQDYIETIDVVDPQTVVVKAKLNGEGKAINPLMVAAYISDNYVVQKGWTQILEARSGYDGGVLVSDPANDFVASGPYMEYFTDDAKVVLLRDDSYWGQHASMWGKLPSPKYLAHVIYPDNDAGLAAFKAGQVDVSQQFNANVQDLWLVDHLPISTYYPAAPYNMGASLPTAFYNLQSYGLDQVAVRKAIAMAVNYNEIIANAITNQSPTFSQVPRSLMNPSPAEQGLYDHAAVADLQWAGNDIAGANALLDTAGIIDTDGDGWREYNGQKLSYVATCPNGWADWQAAVELIAAVGSEIGIDITTNYPEWSDYQNVVTNWPLTEGYDIFMMWSDGSGPTQPWGRIRHLLSSEYAGATGNWNGNWGGYVNPEVDALIQAIPGETDPAELINEYTELTRLYLTDVPSFTVMYRPQQFHTVNESFWSGFPKAGDGTNPPIPPLDLIYGFSIAGLYNLDDAPRVTSSNRVSASLTSAAAVQFAVSFSDTVIGVNSADFKVTTTGITGASIAGVSGSGNFYTVTVNNGAGTGSLRLDIVDNDSIRNVANVALGGAGLGNGNFATGETYTITQGANITIGTQLIGSYPVLPNPSAHISQPNLVDGPVRVTSARGGNLFTSERVISGNSFNEVMGYPTNQLTTEYWFPFYDNSSMTTWILVGNASSTQSAAVDIYVGGVKRGSYTIPIGGQIRPRFNLQTGPVRVISTNGVKIFTSERALYKGAFNEVMGYPASQFTTEYWFPWYDNVSMATWVLVGNPTTSSAKVDIYVGTAKYSYTIAAGKQINQRFPLNTGPVRVVSTNGIKVFTSERVLYGTSFNEVMGYPGNQLSTEYWFPWYDGASMSTDIVVGRP